MTSKTVELAPFAAARPQDERRRQRMISQPTDLELLQGIAIADREAFRRFYDLAPYPRDLPPGETARIVPLGAETLPAETILDRLSTLQ